MPDPNARPEATPGPDDSLVARFARLPLPALVAALREDQSRRWRAGDRVPAEVYLAAFPALTDSPDDALVLIGGELGLRLEAGETPTRAEFSARFPRFADALALQFEIQPLLAATGPVPTTIPQAPRGVGPYTGLAPHAKGGLGEVLRATDPNLHRTVAIKRLHQRHGDNPASQRRFVLEAEITARLEHPGVVPVHGLFQDDHQRPCYAMRFLEGQTFGEAIHAYQAGPAEAVTFRRLLQCFLQVCQTVAYAHSRGVIHRDLKPSNVMLGKFGETIVVDWGLAKVVGRPDELRAVSPEATLQLAGSGSGDETAMGSAVGTPAYMSPEQAAGRWDVIDHATDVYGLGAVLYTVLTGRPPLERGNWPELQQKIQRGDFPRPRQVNSLVPKPLEAVCLKAMALDPADRYPSAVAMAADVEHWLADESVAAYSEPLFARGRRWLRRHRSFVIGAAALLVISLAAAAAGLVLLGRKNQQIVAERNAARQAADEVEAVNAFLTDDLLGQADPDVNSRDKKVTVEQVLAKAAAKIDANPKFAQRPAVEATLRLAIGKTYFKLGNLPEADKHLRRAMDLRREHLPPEDAKTLAAQEAFADFLNLGPARFEESEPLARQTWEARARVLGPEDRDTLDSLDTYAVALHGQRQTAAATTHFRECLAARRRVLGADHPDTLTSMNNLATLLFEQGEWGEAIPLFRELFGHARRQRDPTGYSRTVCNLATAVYLNAELQEADRMLQEHLEWSLKRFGADHRETDRTRGLLVRVWVERGPVEQAVRIGREVVALRRRLYPVEAAFTANALADLGHGLVLRGQHAEAEPALAEALRIYVNSPQYGDYFTAWAKCWHGASLTGLARYPEAEADLLAAERMLCETPMAPRRHHRQAVEQLVKLYEAWAKPDQARAWKKKLEEATDLGKNAHATR
jgi:tRNA A-37 threonylcarbamoyl transferase component Bud32/tetratricopeptide (TPR) repeat protein